MGYPSYNELKKAVKHYMARCKEMEDLARELLNVLKGQTDYEIIHHDLIARAEKELGPPPPNINPLQTSEDAII